MTAKLSASPIKGNLLVATIGTRSLTKPAISGWKEIPSAYDSEHKPCVVILVKIAGESESKEISYTPGDNASMEVVEVEQGTGSGGWSRLDEFTHGATHFGTAKSKTMTSPTLELPHAAYVVVGNSMNGSITGETCDSPFTKQWDKPARDLITADATITEAGAVSETCHWSTEERERAIAIMAIYNPGENVPPLISVSSPLSVKYKIRQSVADTGALHSLGTVETAGAPSAFSIRVSRDGKYAWSVQESSPARVQHWVRESGGALKAASPAYRSMPSHPWMIIEHPTLDIVYVVTESESLIRAHSISGGILSEEPIQSFNAQTETGVINCHDVFITPDGANMFVMAENKIAKLSLDGSGVVSGKAVTSATMNWSLHGTGTGKSIYGVDYTGAKIRQYDRSGATLTSKSAGESVSVPVEHPEILRIDPLDRILVVGTETGISIYDIDPSTEALTLNKSIKCGVKIGGVCYSDDGKLLFACGKANIFAFQIDEEGEVDPISGWRKELAYGSAERMDSYGDNVYVPHYITSPSIGQITSLSIEQDPGLTLKYKIEESEPEAPVAETDAADGISKTAATLHGKVTPNGAATDWQFDYGKGSGLLSTHSPSTVATGTTPEGGVISPDGKFAYVTASERLYQYEIQSDGTLKALSPAYVASAFGAGPISISPDGLHLYVTNTLGKIHVFERSLVTGLCTLVEEKTRSGYLWGVAVSGDGKHVYVGSYEAKLLYYYTRDEVTGKLTETGSLSLAQKPWYVTVFGNNVYTANSAHGSVGQYALSGEGVPSALSPETVTSSANCLKVAVSPDGEDLYAGCREPDPGRLCMFDRDESDGHLTAKSPAYIEGLGGVHNPVVSPDGYHVYLGRSSAGPDANVYERDIETGLLTETTASPEAGANSRDVLITPDGENVYIVEAGSNTVGQFSRSFFEGSIPAEPGESKGGEEAVSSELTGLSAGLKYYFRLSATNEIGTDEGGILSFTTEVPANTGFLGLF